MSESAKRSRKKIASKLPATDVEKMIVFYKKRAEDPLHYVYTPEGDLRIERKEGDETIPLRWFTPLTQEEREEILQRRQEDIAEAEAAYEDSLRNLREAIEKYKATGQGEAAVVQANMEVRDTSMLRSSFAYPSRWIENIDNPTINTILLNQRYETRKMGYSAYVFKRQDLAKRDAWGHYRQGPPPQAVMEGGDSNSQKVVFLTDAENKETGMFHPAALHEFVYNETRYSSPYQAYQGERFRELGNETLRKQILGTRSARTIKSLVQKEEQLPKDPKHLWEGILQSLYEQNADLATRLKETGSVKFHNMDKELGSQDYTDALEHVRVQLREKDIIAEPQVAKEAVITEQQQEEKKRGAIINNFRKRAF